MTAENAGLPIRRRSVRLVRRVDGAQRSPFLPYGLLPVGALALLILFGVTFFSRDIEDTVARAAQRALDTVGASWASIHVSGQWVILEGAPPSREQAARAVAAVREAKAKTLLGEARPATRVTERFVWVGDLAEAARSPATANPARNPAAPASPAPLTAPAPSPPPAAQVDIAARSAPAEACDQSLSALLDTAKMEFAPSSAVIAPGNASLLDSLAAAAAVCPGGIRIEGHTDSSGGAALNRDLSLRRAEAVRAALIERGLPASRLFVEGFGASRPVADNGTADGRERNRRIEIRMAPAPT